MQLRCAKCDKTLEVPDDAGGKKVRCPACLTMMIAPRLSAVEPSGAAAGPRPTAGPAARSGESPVARPAAKAASHRVHCPACDRALLLTPDVAGRIVTCPACERRLRMPSRGEDTRVSEVPPETPGPGGAHVPPGPGPFAPGPIRRPAPGSSPSPGAGSAMPSPGAGSESPYRSPLSPYNTPIGGGAGRAVGHREPVVYVLPGIMMALFAGLSLVFSGLQLILQLVSGNLVGAEAIFLGLFLGVPALVNALILFGGVQMARRQSLTLCRVAAVLAIVPIFGLCCIGNTPFGIWALVVLLMESTSRDFQS